MPDAATVSVRQSLSASSPLAGPSRPFATGPSPPAASATGPGQIPGGARRARRRPLSLLPGLPARSPQLWFVVGFLVSQSVVFLLPLSLRLSRPTWALSRATRAGAAMGGARPRFLLFGDSLTQQSFKEGGWGAALQDQYARKADVILRGYSGYNTRWALYLLPEIFPPQEASSHSGPLSLVTVFFGANDAVLPDRSSKKQYVPLDEYRQNLVKIVTAAQESASTANVVLITPPPVDPPGRLRYFKEVYKEKAVTENERTNENTAKYVEACKDVGRELGVAVVDLFTRIQQRPQWESLLSDGLHFTPDGNKVVFEELMSVIEASFPSLKWEKMPWDFPEHLDIDGENPGKAFS